MIMVKGSEFGGSNPPRTKRRGICCHCACTEDDACDTGCAWKDANKTVCTDCAKLTDKARKVKGAVRLAALQHRREALTEMLAEIDVRIEVLKDN